MKKLIFIVFIQLAIVAGIIGFFFDKSSPSASPALKQPIKLDDYQIGGLLVDRKIVPNVEIKTSLLTRRYQTVILTNGQIYFGRVFNNPVSDFLTLKDVYYFVTENNATALMPLGRREIHQPEDVMYINKKHILTVENLKPESIILEGIKSLAAQSK